MVSLLYVSHIFATTVLPHLYRKITLGDTTSARLKGSTIPLSYARSALLLRTVLHRPDLAALVRQLTINSLERSRPGLWNIQDELGPSAVEYGKMMELGSSLLPASSVHCVRMLNRRKSVYRDHVAMFLLCALRNVETVDLRLLDLLGEGESHLSDLLEILLCLSPHLAAEWFPRLQHIGLHLGKWWLSSGTWPRYLQSPTLQKLSATWVDHRYLIPELPAPIPNIRHLNLQALCPPTQLPMSRLTRFLGHFVSLETLGLSFDHSKRNCIGVTHPAGGARVQTFMNPDHLYQALCPLLHLRSLSLVYRSLELNDNRSFYFTWRATSLHHLNLQHLHLPWWALRDTLRDRADLDCLVPDTLEHLVITCDWRQSMRPSWTKVDRDAFRESCQAEPGPYSVLPQLRRIEVQPWQSHWSDPRTGDDPDDRVQGETVTPAVTDYDSE